MFGKKKEENTTSSEIKDKKKDDESKKGAWEKLKGSFHGWGIVKWTLGVCGAAYIADRFYDGVNKSGDNLDKSTFDRVGEAVDDIKHDDVTVNGNAEENLVKPEGTDVAELSDTSERELPEIDEDNSDSNTYEMGDE